MPSPPLPVPSKAAIRALRGLALGTSCALGLIVEDRRRRISTLRTAIQNKKKLRTSRQYHGAAEFARYSGDDAAILAGDELHWHYRQETSGSSYTATITRDRHSSKAAVRNGTEDDLGKMKQVKHPATPAIHHENEISMIRPIDTPTRASKKLSTQLSSVNATATRASTEKDGAGWFKPPSIQARATPKEQVSQIANLAESQIDELFKKDGTALATYTTAFIAASQVKSVFKLDLADGWLELSRILCKHCQSEGRWEDAQGILAAVVRAGPIDERLYFQYEPIATIESTLSAVGTGDKDVIAKKLHLALATFLAKFEQKPTTHSKEIHDLGKILISRLLEFNHPAAVHQVYWRVLGQQENPEAFTAWFIQTLFEYQDYKSVVKYFRLNFSKMVPDPACLNVVAQLVLESVEAMRGAHVDQVTRALAKLCDAADFYPRAEWLDRLLHARWNRDQDLSKSQDLFNEMLSLGILDRLQRPEEIYRTMVKLSVLAADYTSAQRYHHETLMLAPRMGTDVRLNGHMALMKAKMGAWDEVLYDFSQMKPYGKLESGAYKQSFIAVLKVYIEGHPISDVEEFIKLYMADMDVQLHRYTVTLVANKYGEIHDHEGFLHWLRYCSSEGFTMDPAFTNAILRNCRLKWKFPYKDLRKLQSEMKSINPGAADDCTIRIMHNAALEDGHYAGKSVGQRIRLLEATPSKLPYLSKSANERDVLHAMTEQLARGRPVKASVIYKRALRFGMPWCPKCFQVAVKASIQRNGDDFSMAIKLIGEAHEKGHDVTSAVAVFLKAQVEAYRGTFDDVFRNLKTLITRFESLGILIDSSVLTRIAFASAQFRRYSQAINLCKLAMEKAGTTNPCFSRQNLRTLLMIYWQTLDVKGMLWVVSSLPTSPLAVDQVAYQFLRSAKRHMKKLDVSTQVSQIMQILQSGIDESKRKREQRLEAGSMIHKETIRIMSEAAADLDNRQRKHIDTEENRAYLEESHRTSDKMTQHRVVVEACG